MEIVDEEVPPGTVAAMIPPPGSAVVEGQSIHLTVTKMPGPAEPSQVVLFHHTMPFGLLDRTLTLVLETNGNERTIWEDTIRPGSSVSIPVIVSSPGILKTYVDKVFLEEREVP